jgi:hypothetical protein
MGNSVSLRSGLLALIVFVSAFVLPCGAAFAAGEKGVSSGGGVEATVGDVGASPGGVETTAGDAGALSGGVETITDGTELAPGAYIVVAHPYYKHPVTGVMEDSGQNPGIGQGMTESVLGKEALLEVYDDGSVYVTVRFSLMDNIENIKLSAQKDAESEYVPTEFAIVKESMGEGADAKADIRFEIPGLGAIARAEFYVIAMGRDVIFFMNFTDPVPGEGDFITSPAPDPVGDGVLDAPPSDSEDALVTDAGLDVEELTTTGAESAPANASADNADADAPAGDGKIDVKLFIVIAAVIVAAAVVCGVVLTRGKSKRNSR